MAIVSEDPAMVKYLLDNGADYHQRSIGNFFTADDQKSHRKDVYDQEWYQLPLETNYDGWGISSILNCLHPKWIQNSIVSVVFFFVN